MATKQLRTQHATTFADEETGVAVRFDDAYLGDGVYASFDGFHVVLDLRAQDPKIRIALDDIVRGNLAAFIESVEKKASDFVQRREEALARKEGAEAAAENQTFFERHKAFLDGGGVRRANQSDQVDRERRTSRA